MSKPTVVAPDEMPPPDPPDTITAAFRETEMGGAVVVGELSDENQRLAYRVTAEINRAAKVAGRDRDARTERRDGRYLVVRIDGAS